MSLIHEALKKAERQQKLGEAPTLDTPRFRRRRRKRWPWLLAVLVLLGAAGGAWFWFGGPDRLPPQVADIDAATSPGGQPPDGPRASGKPAAPASSPSSIGRSQEHAVANEPPARTAQNPSNTANTMAQTGPSQRAKPTPEPERQEPAKQQLQTPGSRGMPREIAVAAPGHATTSQPKHEADRQPTPPSAPALARAANPPPSRAPHEKARPRSSSTRNKQQNKPPMYRDLPYSQRENIPQLSISMHMYAAKPAQRFVIINGARHVQGDTLDGGIKLVSIDPAGVTLAKAGHKFRLPRSGTP